MTTTIEQTNSGPGFAHAPDYALVLEPAVKTYSAVLNDITIASSDNAIVMREGDYPQVIYFPPSDVRLDLASKTDHSTYCPFKGDASYWSFEGAENIAWSYQTPYDEMTGIKDYVAFYSDRLDRPV